MKKGDKVWIISEYEAALQFYKEAIYIGQTEGWIASRYVVDIGEEYVLMVEDHRLFTSQTEAMDALIRQAKSKLANERTQREKLDKEISGLKKKVERIENNWLLKIILMIEYLKKVKPIR